MPLDYEIQQDHAFKEPLEGLSDQLIRIGVDRLLKPLDLDKLIQKNWARTGSHSIFKLLQALIRKSIIQESGKLEISGAVSTISDCVDL